jgi:hypothetical protein
VVTPVHAQRRAIVVSAEQPNIWTLEQAHYLLAQMHRRNLDLKAEGLGKLDPNEINGLNLEVMRTLIEFGATFDDADRFNNSLLKPQKRANADRALRLQKRRDEIADESFSLNREIARLSRESALAKTQDEKDSLAAQIAELTSLRDANDKEVERLDKDISSAGGPTGDVKATEPPERTGADKLPESSFDEAFKDAAKTLLKSFNQAPQLNATLRLENFLQMQYEIIAKQLTLLRDEVGPGERIIFLEMPQSVNTVYDKANKKWAQSWWKVAGYTKLNAPVSDTRERSNKRQEGYQNGEPGSDSEQPEEMPNPFFTNEDFKETDPLPARLRDGKDPVSDYIRTRLSSKSAQLLRSYDAQKAPNSTLLKALADDLNNLLFDPNLFATSQRAEIKMQPETARLASQNVERKNLLTLNRRLLEDAYPKSIVRRPAPSAETITMKKIVRDAIDAFGVNGNGSSDRVHFINLDSPDDKLRIEDRSVRTIELIPRQGSLNVNDLKLRVKTGVLTAVARTLFGFGASLNVQRQRETLSQFVQQELYSSAFGKGAREFGWTFAPMPGTDRVLSGAKTTYAVMVVPQEAEALVLMSNGCYFPRSEYQPTSFRDTLDGKWNNTDHSNLNCGGQKAFAVPIPGGADDKNYEFWVDGLEYVPADKVDRVMVSIYGRNFPAQIGMMVDGVPLTQSIGVAQPLIRDDSTAFAEASEELKDSKVLGRIERIDSNQIVAVFERPKGKDGAQPVLMLTAPGKAKILNKLKLLINGQRNVALNDDDTPLLFGTRPGQRPRFRIDKVDVFKSRTPGMLNVAVSGAGFPTAFTRVLLNGVPRDKYSVESPTLLRFSVLIPSDDTIKVTLIVPDPNPANPVITIESAAIVNPAKLRVTNVSVITYEPRTEDDPGTLVVKIEGSGFSDDLRAFLTQTAAAEAVELAVKSSTEAILTLTNPQPAVVIILRDMLTGQETKTVITRKSP